MTSITERIAALPATQRALIEERLRRQKSAAPVAEPIALVGMGCRFPGGISDPETYWNLLKSRTDATSTVPAGRWDAERLHDPESARPGTVRSTRGGFLDSIDTFDAEFFGIPPREAETLDPQHRLLLEVAWEALEHMGQAPTALRGTNTGVFVGIGIDDYKLLQTSDLTRLDGHMATGNLFCTAAGRISYLLGLHGPSLAVDTGCSSSLVTIHLAMQSLRSGECDLALAGGVHLMIAPEMTVDLSQAGVLSPQGRSRAFDAAADGYARGEGAGIVVLKRLADAEAAGDTVLAVLRGSAVNHGGRGSGLTVPNGSAQKDLITTALKAAGAAPADVDYVETHGTGTPIGDPIEANALGAAYRPGRDPGRPLLMGTVKTNLGHLEAAAGVAGLMKVVLSLRHQEIPAHLHLRDRTPHVSWDELLLDVPSQARPWPRGARPRLAGVSSFGIGGTNAHVIVAEAPASATPPADAPDQVRPDHHPVALSGRDESALRRVVEQYRRHLAAHPDLDPAGLTYSANTGRAHFAHRAFFVVADTEDLTAQLAAWQAPSTSAAPRGSGRELRTAFLFTGQASQYLGMGAGLYTCQPVFRQALDTCAELLRERYGWFLTDLLYAPDADPRLIDRTEYAQPALLSLAYALVSMWQAWGVRPSVVLGHSIGEFAGACAAGVLRLEDALTLVAERGRLMGQLPDGGGMAVLTTDEATVSGLLAPYAGRLSVAAVNGPLQTAVSGPVDVLDDLLATARDNGVGARRLTTSHAFHSALMDPILGPFSALAAGLTHRPGTVPVISTVTGAPVRGEDMAGADYWRRNAREPVRFLPAVHALLERRFDVALEIGPDAVLSRLVTRQGLDPREDRLWLPSLTRRTDDWQQVLQTLGSLYRAGADIDWQAVHAGTPKPKVLLPTYPFGRKRYWRDTRAVRGERPAGTPVFPGAPLSSPALTGTVYQSRFTADSPAFLADHVLFDEVVVPAASHLAMTLAAAVQGLTATGEGAVLEGVSFPQALTPADAARDVQLIIQEPEGPEPAPGGPGDPDAQPRKFRVVSAPADGTGPRKWTSHALGTLRPTPPPAAPLRSTPPGGLFDGPGERLDGADFYAAMHAAGADLGPGFCRIRELRRHQDELLVRMDSPEYDGADGPLLLHPGLVDACVQAVVALAWSARPDVELGVRVPIRLDALRFHKAPPSTRLWCRVQERPELSPDGDTVVADLSLLDQDGEVVLEMDGLWVRRVSASALLRRDTALVRCPTWQDSPAALPSVTAATDWLVLADRRGVGSALAARLRDAGHRVTVAEAGSEADDEDALKALVRESAAVEAGDAGASGRPRPLNVAFLRGLDLPEGALTGDVLDEVQQHGTAALLAVLQALAGTADGSRILVATRGAQSPGTAPVTLPSVSPAPVVGVAHAPLWGLAAIANAENPDVRCVLVDLDPDVQSPEGEAAALFAEALGNGEDAQVAVRAGRRHVAGTAAIVPSSGAAAGSLVRTDGTYLVTGGLGALGLHTADWLVRRGARHLALVGRRDPSAAAERSIRAWQQEGVRVAVHRADVADFHDVQRVLTDVSGSLPPLRGVVHAAGVLDDGGLQRQNTDRLRAVMAPKMRGAWNLHELTQDAELDFFALYSSVAALMGSRGQSGYAAANSFLDALAHHRQALGLPGTSVAWGPWSGDGMVATLDERAGRRVQDSGFGMLKPEPAFRALEEVLRSGVHHAYVYAGESADARPARTDSNARPRRQEPSATRQAAYDRPEVLGAAVAARNATEAALVTIWESLLGIHPIGIEDDYFQLGGDSITSLRVISRAKQAGIRLTEADFFTHPTVAQLAATAETVAAPESPQANADPASPQAATDPGPRPELDRTVPTRVPTTHLAEGDLQRLLSRLGGVMVDADGPAAHHDRADVTHVDASTERRNG
ncbi:SDR family NAD(P)-dependent oxidoreductase [Streptomyces sp. NPDC004129]|uniref:type I polyketide synthase n=1 Tax=Streptomyces sp. NPDC004533 TaxID=3154278 RepID=UPI0033BC43A3